MISYINGNLIHKEEGKIVVECGGIGYDLFVSNNTLTSLPLQNEHCQILTYLQVKEDGLILFGFSSFEEKSLFLKLIEVNGIGPKLAINILSGMKLDELMIAIANENVKMLTKIKGLGTKSAERICLELKDKIDVLGKINENFEYDLTSVGEAVEALVSLGLTKTEALTLAKSCATIDSTSEEIVTKALKEMGR